MPYLKDADPLFTNILCSKILTEVTKAALIYFPCFSQQYQCLKSKQID